MLVKSLGIALLLFTLSGCTGTWQRIYNDDSQQAVSSSLVDYLYPNGQADNLQEAHAYATANATPLQLNLPLSVGIAFVPSHVRNTVLSEAEKTRLLTKVKQHFLQYDYVQSIQIIPEIYLRQGKGFQTLEQVARLYNVDLMALVSYDQIVHSDDTNLSLLYWTIVGAYLIPASEHNTQTFVDTVLFDVKTKQLLFRAPGIDKSTSHSTLVKSVQETRDIRLNSFQNAVTNMIVNLEDEMRLFKERLVKEKIATISYRTGYTGGGGGSVGWLALLVALFYGSRHLKNFLPRIFHHL